MKCPICGAGFKVTEELVASFTCDCPSCGGLLLVEDSVVYDFHRKMHEENPSWPADGEGAGYIEVSLPPSNNQPKQHLGHHVGPSPKNDELGINKVGGL